MLRQQVVTAWKQASERQAPLLAAGVAFYAFLSLFPAMIAAVALYGLFASPETVQRQSERIADALPADAASVVNGQLESLTSTSPGSLGLGLVVALALAIYGASGGVGHLVTAINQMFGQRDRHNFLEQKAQALLLTLGAIAFFAAMIALVAVAPAVLDSALLGSLRWVLVGASIKLAIAVLFRIAPDRRGDTGPLISKGVLVASGLWIAASVGFSVYVDNFGSYAKTYGALAGVVVLLLWLWVGVYALLLGATVESLDEGISSLVE
ncbi:membrane protein [Aeromicrobium panaciterrae]|uniref:Membrane protein n=1 Tax=Aeromicrobium panaciterrae TaxID=363861 RepID=A0ABU1UN83_9ACTN|nr:YihY/virulence factor BrkB family protein [Aeromicrobium panaciterrae]MDR7086617.1 membrane protein [Aeromicrobium panaciterrae]